MYYLSFDCATKSLAFVIAYVNVDKLLLQESNILLTSMLTKELTKEFTKKFTQEITNLEQLQLQLQLQLQKEELTKLKEQLQKIKSNLIQIIDGETVDLFPNIADVDILTVDRIKALVFYVRKRILPALASLTRRSLSDIPKLQILIEFQMGANPKARMIFAALIAVFADYDVKLVNPSLKNKIHFSEEGKHKHFIKKYSQLYSANKAHTKYNFEQIERIFGTNIKKSTNTERGHIADSFMQILGKLYF